MKEKKILLLASMVLMLGMVLTGFSEAEEIVQLTLEDIRAMNGGEVRYSTNQAGNITFLAGKFYDGKIETEDEIARAVTGMNTLLGADSETSYRSEPGIIDDNGYTYYILRQWHGATGVQGSVIKVIVNPDGEAAAISSSVVSGVGSGMDLVITPEEAETIVRQRLEKNQLNLQFDIYSGHTEKVSIPYSRDMANLVPKLYLAYAVYSNNPAASHQGADMPCLAHYVSAEGKYLYSMPVLGPGTEQGKAGGDNLSIFQGKTAVTYTGTVTLHDGSQQEVTVPVLYDESQNLYYLADAERKIVLADFWEFVYHDGNLAFTSGSENAGWEDKDLISYSNYIKIYDFYHEVGWDSTDGLGTPILILTNFCDKNHTPTDNACYIGQVFGWSCFGTSRINDFSECLDVLAHEYTHGFTDSSMTEILYYNETGAINESFSDIMGNLAELLLGGTDDTTWLIGEQCGEAMRCMSNPHAYGQPEFIGDMYYGPEPAVPSLKNDLGGVHINNSILCMIPPILERAGMTLEQQRLLWTTAICSITPKSGYRDFYEIFSFAARLTGLSEYQPLIDATFEKLGIIGENAGKPAALQEGCGRITFSADSAGSQYETGAVMVFDEDNPGRRVCATWADKENRFSLQLPEGNYFLRLQGIDKKTKQAVPFRYTPDGWKPDAEGEEIPVPVTAGEQTELMHFTAP